MATNLRLPDFIGIGAPRCGTTWLSKLLNMHSKIYFDPHYKELHYFNGKHFDKGLSWYLKFFQKVPEEHICGEFTPSYMIYNNSAELIKEVNPKIKLIVCLRNPINRAYSHYWQRNRYKRWKDDFEKTIIENTNNILDFGLYGQQLEKYYQIFPKEQIFVVFFEDIITNTEHTLTTLFDFLKVENQKLDIQQARKNVMKVVRSKTVTIFIRVLRNTMRTNHFMRKLFYYQLSGQTLIELLRKINKKKGIVQKEEISVKIKEYLQEYYANDKRLLEELINEEITIWE